MHANLPKSVVMKTVLKTGLIAGLLLLAGCYYDPGYVRSDGYYGDAYYGTTTYEDGYYGGYYSPAYSYGPGYYDPYYWGPAFGLGIYYSDHGHYHGHGHWNGNGGHHGSWSGGHGGHWSRGGGGHHGTHTR